MIFNKQFIKILKILLLLLYTIALIYVLGVVTL